MFILVAASLGMYGILHDVFFFGNHQKTLICAGARADDAGEARTNLWRKLFHPEVCEVGDFFHHNVVTCEDGEVVFFVDLF